MGPLVMTIRAKITGDTVTVTMPAAKADALREELLWVKADDDGPTIELWTALDNLHSPEGESDDPKH
jgi:hypothetical protein